MATITITIPDEQASRVQAAFAERVGKGAGPETVTLDDVKGELVSLIKIIVREHEKNAAAAAATQGVVDVDPS